MPINPVTGVYTPLFDWVQEAAARERTTPERLFEQDEDFANAINGLLEDAGKQGDLLAALLRGGIDDGVYEPQPSPVPVQIITFPTVTCNDDDGLY
jgi:hypothetical protein